MENISKLEATHALKILIILHTEGKMVKGDLASKVAKGTVAVQARIEDLVELGLVTETKESRKPFRKYIELTSKGKEVADHLCLILNIISS